MHISLFDVDGDTLTNALIYLYVETYRFACSGVNDDTTITMAIHAELLSCTHDSCQTHAVHLGKTQNSDHTRSVHLCCTNVSWHTHATHLCCTHTSSHKHAGLSPRIFASRCTTRRIHTSQCENRHAYQRMMNRHAQHRMKNRYAHQRMMNRYAHSRIMSQK